MLPATPESAFIFSLFQFLLSGLIWLVSSFLLLRTPPRNRVRALYFLVAAFFLYSGHLFFAMVEGLGDLTGSSLSLPPFLFPPLRDSLATGALVCLVFVYLPHRIPRGRFGVATLILAALLLVTGVNYVLGEQRLPGTDLHADDALNLVLILGTGSLYLRRRGTRGLFTASPLLPLLLSELARVHNRLAAPPTNLENFLKLASLLLFALVLDQKSRNLYVQVFVRLNLIFILLAGGLILTIAETDRKHYLSFAESNVQDLSEFLRGHVLYFWKQGQSPQQILANPEIIRKVVSEFGRVPTLRRVRIFLGYLRLEMSIAPDGTVDHQVGQVVDASDAPPSGHGQERITTLVKLPIVLQQQHLGQIEIDESLQMINARIASKMLTVFLTFTAMAVVSGTLIGLTVRDANRTIRRQYLELERANQQLFHAAKLTSVGQLADGIAHEINNPAGIILARSEYLASVIKERGGFSGIQEDIEAIRRQARRIAEIVGGLLTFSRPSALRMRQLDLNSLVTECLALLSPKFYARNIEVHCNLDKSLPGILADPDRLEQVFINILNNAIQAMPHGGQVTVATGTRPEREVYVQVSDTGAGIAEEDLRKIFDPFFTTKQPGGGTGLGLSVSYRIVRDHGGRIEVTSSPGQGATFQVILPLGEVPDDQL